MGWKSTGPRRQGLCFSGVLGLAPHALLNHLPMLYSALHGFVCWSHRHTVRSSWVLEAFGHCTSLGECLQGTQDGHRQKFMLPLGRGIWIPTAALSSRGPTCIILVLKGRGRGGDNVGSSLRNAMVQTLGSNLNFPPCK